MIASSIVADTFWTPADIAKLKAAVASGALTVKYSGPPSREITYQSLDAMRAVLAEMRREVNGSPTYRLGATRKGLGAQSGSDGET